MKDIVFKGVATALVTPMNDDGSVNYARLAELVEWQTASGADALVICGTTGEKSTLKYDEHVKVIETAVKASAGRIPVIAGTGSNDTVYTVELCRDAEAVGADALLTVTPYYNKTSQAGLVAHFNYIADRVTKPVILYNVPSRTGVNIKPESYRELAKHPKIVAVKEANGDLSSIAETRYLCGDELTVYSGNDDLIVPIMSLGGLGVISVLSNLLPKEVHSLCSECLKGDFRKAAELQLKYTGLIGALFCDVNPVPVKAALKLMGRNTGFVRLPLYPLSRENSEFLRDKMYECGLI